MRHRTTEDEPPRLESGDCVDLFAHEWRQKLIHGQAKAARVLKQGGHIPKQDALMREIRDRADIVADGLVGWHGGRDPRGWRVSKARVMAAKCGSILSAQPDGGVFILGKDGTCIGG